MNSNYSSPPVKVIYLSQWGLNSLIRTWLQLTKTTVLAFSRSTTTWFLKEFQLYNQLQNYVFHNASKKLYHNCDFYMIF